MKMPNLGLCVLLLAVGQVLLAEERDGQDLGTDRSSWHAIPKTLSAAEQPVTMGPYRQLFVDDRVISSMDGLTWVLNEATRHPANPLLVPEYPWEGVDVYLYGSVLYDDSEKLFKMWYNAWGPASGSRGCYATSKDGIRWEKPKLGIVEFEGSKENNLIDWRALGVTCTPDEPHPARRYQSFDAQRGIFSRDGIHWPDPPAESRNIPGGIVSDDVIPFCYDELSDRYIAFGKVNRVSGQHNRRSVSVAVSKDFLEWTKAKAVLIPDARDDALARTRTAQLRDRVTFFEEDVSLRSAQFYQMSGFPYEGMYLGLLAVFDISGWTPGARKISAAGGEDGPVQIELVSSRDLLHWNRVGDRKLLIPVGAKNTWEASQIYIASRPVIVDDEIWIYYAGMKQSHGHPMYQEAKRYLNAPSNGAIGIATLRLDGWVSMDAGAREGTLTTKPFVLKGNTLIVNAQAPRGAVTVAILDRAGRPLSGFASSDCQVFSGDAVRHRIRWKHQSELQNLAGRTVRLRFTLREAKLYSFVVRPN